MENIGVSLLCECDWQKHSLFIKTHSNKVMFWVHTLDGIILGGNQ